MNKINIKTNNANTHINLANKLIKKGQLEQAIHHYKAALEIDENHPLAWHQQGIIYAQKGELEAAVNCYQKAIQILPKNDKIYTILAGIFKKQGKTKDAINAYQKAFQLNPNQPFGVYINLGNLLHQQSQLDAAIATYQKAVKIQPENSVPYKILAQVQAETGDIEGTIISYQKFLELQPDQPLGFYNNLKNLFRQSNQLDRAISFLQEATKLQPKNFAFYRFLAIFQAEKGYIEEAIVTHQKSIDFHPDLHGTFRTSLINILGQHEKVYSHIWNTLNQNKLDTFNESNLCYQKNIKPATTYKYFTQISKYKVVNLKTLTTEDKLFLQTNKISLYNLKKISQDSIKQEDIYLKKNYQNLKNILEKLVQTGQIKNEFHVFQESMVETGHIYAPCPISGNILSSNLSFFLQGNLGFYRFVGDEVFYLICEGPAFKKKGIYFPKLELIVGWHIAEGRKLELERRFSIWVNMLKRLAVIRWREVIDYIAYKGNRETVLTYGWMASTAHNLLNELTGIQRLLETGRLNKVDKILVGNCEYYGKVEEIFPEIPSEKIVRLSDAELLKLPQIILENKYFALHAGEVFITEALAKRIYQASVKNCTPSFLNQVEAAKSHSLLLFITIRTHNRTWISQVAGIANIINQLLPDFPNLGVVFDGISFLDKDGEKLILQEREKAMLESEQSLLKEIVKLLPQNFVNFYNSIGCLMCESIVWAKTADFYIAPFGGGLAKLTYIANKPGIVHTNHTVLNTRKNAWYNNRQRENGIMPTYLKSNCIIEDSISSTKPMAYSYDFDWTIVYDEILKQIKTSKLTPRTSGVTVR